MIIRILKTLGISLLFLTVFLVITFPFQRLTPRFKQTIEKSLSANFGIPANCVIDDLDFKFPFGVQWSKLTCVDEIGAQRVIDFGESSLLLLPGRQVFSTAIGKGTLSFRANAGLSSTPSRIQAEFENVPLERILPLLMGAANKANSQIPKYLKAEGKLQGRFDVPLKNLHREKGQIDLQFSGLKFPQQSQLDLIGVKDLNFSKSSLKVGLSNGKMTLSDVNFISDQLSGKAEGNIEISEDLKKSMGNLTLKWKLEKSDAVLSSLLGPMLVNNCPSPDSEGFCTRRYQRLSELGL